MITCREAIVRCDVLESNVSRLLTEEVTSEAFISRLRMTLENSAKDERRAGRIRNLESESKSLEAKRQRVLDSFLDGDITRDEKTARLAKVAQQIAKVSEELARERESILPPAALDQLEGMWQQFSDWEFWSRSKRRSVLSVTIPRFCVDGPEVKSFYSLMESREVAVPGFSALHHKKSQSRPAFLVMKKAGCKYDRSYRIGSLEDGPTQCGVWIDLSA